MLTKTMIGLATALVLGTASAALAGDSGENHQDNDKVAVSTTTRAPAAREAHQNTLRWNSSDRGRDAFAYQPSNPSARPTTSFEQNWFSYQSQE